MSENPGNRVLWKASSSWHDWRGGAPLRRLIQAAAHLGLIGSPQWMRPMPDSIAHLATTSADEIAASVLAVAATQGRVAELTIGGGEPSPWELFWNVYPFDTAESRVDGLNTIWLTFDRTRVRDRAQSDALLEAFFTAHQPEDTEYAVLHPYAHWSDFADQHYKVPVTINLQFKGVFWANFLGPGHLDEFDREKLSALEAHEVRWLEGDGLFVVTTPDLASADAPESEVELLRLTALFREALRPDSRWQ